MVILVILALPFVVASAVACGLLLVTVFPATMLLWAAFAAVGHRIDLGAGRADDAA